MSSLTHLLSIRTIAVLVFSLGAFGGNAGCSHAADDQPVTALQPASATTKFDVAWKDSTVQITEAEAMTVIDPDVKDGAYHFPATSRGIAALTKGTVVLLPGIGLFNVVGIETSDIETVLSTENASLLDAATKGDVEFDIPLTEQQGRAAVGYLAPKSNDSIVQAPTSVSWSGTVTPFSVDAKMTPSGDAQSYELNVGYQDAKSSMKLGLTGKINPFHAKGKCEFEGGKLKEGWVRLDDIDGEATVDIASVAMVGKTSFPIPIAIGFPFEVGPIPMFASFSLGMELNASLAFKQSSLTSTRKFSFHGSTGLQWQNGSILPLGKLDVSDGQLLQSSASAQFTVGLGFVMDVPRVDVGVGRPATIGLQLGPTSDSTPPARISIYAKVRAEGVSNFEVTLNGNTKTSCSRHSTNIGAYVGGELKLFSLGITQEKQVWGVVRQSQPEGDGCQ